MTGVPRHIVEHRLNVREGCQPIRQKKRGQAAERNIAINDEVSKLVATKIIREVHYHDWLSNPLMVKKHDDSWRMCVDFKDLNKACPNDGYNTKELDMPRQGRRRTKPSITKMPERSAETKWKVSKLKQMKEHIAKLPMLTAPEELIIYLATSKEAVSAVLCQPGAKGPGSKLHLHGKTGASTSTCKQKAKKILLSSSNHSSQEYLLKEVLADFIMERPEKEGQDDSTKE
ncbi:hypothetical protein Tco_0032465 [Tanacetum coccineum]